MIPLCKKNKNIVKDSQNDINVLKQCTKKIVTTGVLGNNGMYWRVCKFARFNGYIIITGDAIRNSDNTGGFVSNIVLKIDYIDGKCNIRKVVDTFDFGVRTFTKARLVYNSEYTFLELYTGISYKTVTVTAIVLGLGPKKAERWNEVGNIPSGYSVKEIEI